MTIREFKGPNAWLSNFWPWEGPRLIGPPAAIFWKGVRYAAAEYLYQVTKGTNEADRAHVLSQRTPGAAKRAGKDIIIRPDWGEIRRDVMLKIQVAKYAQNPALLQKLFETDDAELIEGNTWGDIYWGVDLRLNYGENWLGKIIMLVRDQVFRSPDCCQLIDRICASGRLTSDCKLYFEEQQAA